MSMRDLSKSNHKMVLYKYYFCFKNGLRAHYAVVVVCGKFLLDQLCLNESTTIITWLLKTLVCFNFLFFLVLILINHFLIFLIYALFCAVFCVLCLIIGETVAAIVEFMPVCIVVVWFGFHCWNSVVEGNVFANQLWSNALFWTWLDKDGKNRRRWWYAVES